jgi:hypothetical protein
MGFLSRRLPAPPLVALGFADPAVLRAAAAQARLPFFTSLPSTGDFIVALAPGQPLPALPSHIPVIHSLEDLPHRLEQALLYLQAHRGIRR